MEYIQKQYIKSTCTSLIIMYIGWGLFAIRPTFGYQSVFQHQLMLKQVRQIRAEHTNFISTLNGVRPIERGLNKRRSPWIYPKWTTPSFVWIMKPDTFHYLGVWEQEYVDNASERWFYSPPPKKKKKKKKKKNLEEKNRRPNIRGRTCLILWMVGQSPP